MEVLKRRILTIVSNCNKPKVRTFLSLWDVLAFFDPMYWYLKWLTVLQYCILLQGCWYELFGGEPDNFPTEMDNRREHQLSQPLLGEESLIIHPSASYQSLASDDSPTHTPPHFFLPGRVLHITEDGPPRRSVHQCFIAELTPEL